MDNSIFSISLECIDRYWDTRSIDHFDVIHEILTKSQSSDIYNIYAINFNEIKEQNNSSGLAKVGALLNMMNFMFYRTTSVNMGCKLMIYYNNSTRRHQTITSSIF